MAGYGWAVYDIRKGGMQVINDTGNELDLTTYFSKVSDEQRRSEWGLRVKGIPRSNARGFQKTTVISYLGIENSDSEAKCIKEPEFEDSKSIVVCDGMTKGLGRFQVQISGCEVGNKLPQTTSVKSLKVSPDVVWQAKTIFTNQLKGAGSYNGIIADDFGDGNLHFVQQSFKGGFKFDVLFSSEPNSSTITSSTLTESIQDAQSTFSDRFNSVYFPQPPFQDEPYIGFSQSLLSNLMGGIGYFYGTSKIDVSSVLEYKESDERFRGTAASARSRAAVEEQGPYELFTSVPSRPFFPRGFLWDEGFHLLVIMDWDMDVALDIVSSWFNLMNDDGWIAREQILGPEARTKVPLEFQTQHPQHANPPTLFMIVEAFVARLDGKIPYSGAPSRYLGDPTAGKAFLCAIYPKMKTHYEWFCRTQAGNLEAHRTPDSNLTEGYRWRGRTSQHSLTSGDYPRAQPPHSGELHVDALCWVGTMAVALSKISVFVDKKEDMRAFMEHETNVVRSIDDIHWSDSDQAYCDTTIVDVATVKNVCHKGYLTLFPFFTNLMAPDHVHLEVILDLIGDSEELWSPYGLRSLSPKDQFHGTDENYWRSPVWININYMVLQRVLVRTTAFIGPLSDQRS